MALIYLLPIYSLVFLLTFLDSCATYGMFSFWTYVCFNLNNWVTNLLLLLVVCFLLVTPSAKQLALPVLFFSIAFVRSPRQSYTYLFFYKSAAPLAQLVDGLIQVHPPLFYLAVFSGLALLVTQLKPQLLSTYYAQPRALTLLTCFFFCLLCLVSLFSGSYWSYLQFSWGAWWSWDPIEVVLLGALILAVSKLHHMLYTPSAWLWLFFFELFSYLVAYVVVVRLGWVVSRHSFFENPTVGTSQRLCPTYVACVLFCFCFGVDIVFFRRFLNLRSSPSSRCDKWASCGVFSGSALLACALVFYQTINFSILFQDKLALWVLPTGCLWITGYATTAVFVFVRALLPTFGLTLFSHLFIFLLVMGFYLMYDLNIKFKCLKPHHCQFGFGFSYDTIIISRVKSTFFRFNHTKNVTLGINAVHTDKPHAFFVRVRGSAFYVDQPVQPLFINSDVRNFSMQLTPNNQQWPCFAVGYDHASRLVADRRVFDDDIMLDNVLPAFDTTLRTICSISSFNCNLRFVASSSLPFLYIFLANHVTVFLFFVFFCLFILFVFFIFIIFLF